MNLPDKFTVKHKDRDYVMYEIEKNENGYKISWDFFDEVECKQHTGSTNYSAWLVQSIIRDGGWIIQ